MPWQAQSTLADTKTEVEAEFERIFTRHYRAVFYFFISQGASESDSHDLTQDTFLRVYKSMESFRGESSLRGWILLIAMNVWKNELRHRGAKKREGKEISLEEVVQPPDDDGAGREPPETGTAGRPADQMLAAERVKLLRRALGTLPAQMRRCALLRFAGDLKYREIASALQISIETVKSQIYQARLRLQAALGEE
jgi:RNA polymerase sigma-70 factor (ECF subfamily)